MDNSKIYFLALVAVCLFALGGYAIYQNRDITLEYDKDGKLSFQTIRGETVTEMLHRAILETQPADDDKPGVASDKGFARNQLNAVFQAHGYYHFNDTRLLDEFRDIKTTAPISVGLRDMLYGLEGPFAVPGALRGAEESFWAAIEDVYTSLRENPELENTFFNKIYGNFLEQQSIFDPIQHRFEAEIRLISNLNSPQPVVLACHSSFLKPDINVLLKPIEDGQKASGMLASTIKHSTRFHTCAERVSAQEALRGKRVQLGVNRAAFKKLYAGVEDWRADETVVASVLVYPRNTAPADFYITFEGN